MDYTLQLTILTAILFGIFIIVIGIGYDLRNIAEEIRKRNAR